MTDIILPVVFGIIAIGIGYCNIRGDVSTVHWYHRMNLLPKDRLKFGRFIGMGTIIIGLSVIFGGVVLNGFKPTGIFFILSNVILLIGLFVGCVFCLYGIIKYNGSLFSLWNLWKQNRKNEKNLHL